ncbi:hypothetical protein [Pediococcus damnosus]|uniref:Uncharacterized protein n=1 Tax=Pediococcus damnosus TaxID=51663 RepID=A0AAC9B3W4_9LACO|nr:hypothetical protein [Pediococcus damnosus]AMV61105.1 hypothetical protein ADU69_1454 [Pediococcus damnosus]AMV63661.1 hypothetical protein ADU70_2199 [Pediococcus damnosus]AMV65464.1 hypothetical protein ADU71_1574 [Pediococcus damnosus]AMV68697.1 hypothetical protein ADU73_0287 [Pediococcus damnosus]KJU74555.1 hypothetical protein AH70_06090 [Pediococcus damnosus LMG 28219]
MSNSVSITELTAPNQLKAVTTFAKFYIKLYKSENLEIISSYVPAGYLSDINAFIARNRYLTKEELLSISIEASRADYIQVIAHLGQSFTPNGAPEISWNDWEISHHKHLVVES